MESTRTIKKLINVYLLVSESDEIGSSSGTVTYNNRHRGRVRDIFQDRPDSMCPTLDHQTYQGGEKVGGKPLTRYELLQLSSEGDFSPVFTGCAIVDHEKIGMMLVETDIPRPKMDI